MPRPNNYPQTREDAIAILGELRVLEINKTKVNADRDAEVAKIDARVNPHLDDIAEQTKAKSALLKTWAELNPDEFGEAKSIQSLHGSFGWRLGNWTVAPLKPLTWAKILHVLKGLGYGAAKYIRQKEEVNQELLIADRASLDETNRRKIGIKFSQQNRWFIEPNTTDPNP